jgi:hypothetical protein
MARVLVRILQSTLRTLIALKFPGSVASLSFLGISDIKAPLKGVRKRAIFKCLLVNHCQYRYSNVNILVVEYSIGRPSKQGDFPAFIDKMAALTSSSVIVVQFLYLAIYMHH